MSLPYTSWRWLAVAAFVACSACPPPPPPPKPQWQILAHDLPSALLSVWGASAEDVWAVGSDAQDGKGPLVLHFDGTAWARRDTGVTGGLWWVFGFAQGPVYFGGEGGLILKWESGAFTRMTTPGNDVVYGLWGASPDDVWAVGGESGGAQGAFAWRLHNGTWAVAPSFPPGLSDHDALWKVAGRAANDVWLVGTGGKVVHWDGSAFTVASAGTGESLFTVHASSQRFVAVGGFGTGKLLENDGSGWVNKSPPGAPMLNGVFLTETTGFAVGQYAGVYTRADGGWAAEDTGFMRSESLHAVWVDPSGGAWAAGGDVLSIPLKNGLLLHRGKPISEVSP